MESTRKERAKKIALYFGAMLMLFSSIFSLFLILNSEGVDIKRIFPLAVNVAFSFTLFLAALISLIKIIQKEKHAGSSDKRRKAQGTGSNK
jgi:hypothetical protein